MLHIHVERAVSELDVPTDVVYIKLLHGSNFMLCYLKLPLLLNSVKFSS
jgi:hypothetical protein